mgnify:CR=1 FL=1
MIYRSDLPDVAIPDATVTEHVIGPAAARGDKPALIDGVSGAVSTYAELAAAVDRVAAGLQAEGIGKGDVVLFHTGWLSLIDKDPKRFGSVEPGLGREGARYLVSKNVVAIGADTWGLEAIPFEKDAGIFEVHQILLPMSGTYILENINTAALAADLTRKAA